MLVTVLFESCVTNTMIRSLALQLLMVAVIMGTSVPFAVARQSSPVTKFANIVPVPRMVAVTGLA